MNKNDSTGFDNDIFARKVVRFLLIFQVVSLLSAIILTLYHESTIAQLIAIIALVLFVGVISWMYIRYQTYPIVQEKNKLCKISSSLEAQILADSTDIDLTHQERDRLHHAEKEEYFSALKRLQDKHIIDGLENTLISEASIPGVGPVFKERLIAHGIKSAKDINPNDFIAEGFGVAKSQAVIAWRNQVYSEFNSNKPRSLPTDSTKRIINKYQVHHVENDAQEERIQASKEKHEKELEEILAQLNRLDSIKYSNYVWKTLSPQGMIAGVIAAVLIFSQVGLGFGTTIGAIVNAIPTSTLTPTVTLTSTMINSPTITKRPTITNTPTQANTPTLTITPTISPTPTETPIPSNTPIATPTIPSIIASCIPKNTLRQVGSVVSITDGDTIEVRLDDGMVYPVRYIGIDTPERGQINYDPSAQKNTDLVYGKNVTLIKDVSDVDQYNRLLRYVVVGDVFVNYELVRSGLAYAVDYPPDIACESTFSEAQDYAKDNLLGLWVPLPALEPTNPTRGGNCDPAYPDVCIPSPPPDLDCKDIPFRRFMCTQGQPDRHVPRSACRVRVDFPQEERSQSACRSK
jgi:micrococcal nuclease